MKWPSELLLIRHAESAYNILKKRKERDPDYQQFKELFEADPANPELRPLAAALNKRFALNCSDRETPITPTGEAQARITGRRMRQFGMVAPDVIFVSPYLRTMETLRFLKEEWPELESATLYPEERIREKDHGLALLYNDWRIFQAMQPEQAELSRLLGEYDYRFVNGENIPDVRQRTRSWFSTLTREFAGHRVMAITSPSLPRAPTSSAWDPPNSCISMSTKSPSTAALRVTSARRKKAVRAASCSRSTTASTMPSRT